MKVWDLALFSYDFCARGLYQQVSIVVRHGSGDNLEVPVEQFTNHSYHVPES